MTRLPNYIAAAMLFVVPWAVIVWAVLTYGLRP